METKIYYKKNIYTDKKTGEERTAYNYILVYANGLYVNINPTFNDDYFTLNSLRRKGLITEYEN